MQYPMCAGSKGGGGSLLDEHIDPDYQPTEKEASTLHPVNRFPRRLRSMPNGWGWTLGVFNMRFLEELRTWTRTETSFGSPEQG